MAPASLNHLLVLVVTVTAAAAIQATTQVSMSNTTAADQVTETAISTTTSTTTANQPFITLDIVSEATVNINTTTSYDSSESSMDGWFISEGSELPLDNSELSTVMDTTLISRTESSETDLPAEDNGIALGTSFYLPTTATLPIDPEDNATTTDIVNVNAAPSTTTVTLPLVDRVVIKSAGGVDIPWPVKKEAVVEGDLVLGGLMMVHEREDSVTCGPVMLQGGVQALEAMLYTLDMINAGRVPGLHLPNVTLGAHILDDCDKDTYGLEMAVDFIKGE